MNRESKRILINSYIEAVTNSNKVVDLFRPICSINDDVFELIYSYQGFANKAFLHILGDQSEWVDWYIYENDCGKRQHEAGYDKKVKKICNINDLLDLIEEGERRK